MGERKRLVKSTAVFAVFTFVSRIFGYARDLVRAYYLGTSDASDAFGVAITIPNLFRRLLGEGAMSAAFVPVLSDLKNKPRKEWEQYIGSFFTLLSALLAIVVVGGILLAPMFVPEIFARGFAGNPAKMELTIALTRISFLYLLFIGLAALLQGILNTFKLFGPSAFTPVLLNISIIFCAVGLSPFVEEPAYAFVIGFVLGGVLQLAFQYPFLKKVGVRLRPAFAWASGGVRRSLRLMGPALLGFGVYEINIATSQLIATYLGEGAISSLQYSNRMMELPLGIFVAAISTVILPTLAEKGHARDMDGYRHNLGFALRSVLLLTILAAAFLFIMRKPMFTVLLGYGAFSQTSINLTAFAFMFHIIGLPMVGLSRVLVPAFYALEDTKTPVMVAFWAMLTNIVVAVCTAIWTDLGNGGIALAASVSALLQAALLLWLLNRRQSVGLSVSRLLGAGAKLVLAALPLVAVCLLALPYIENTSRLYTFGGFVGAFAVAAVVYAVFLILLRVEDASEVWNMVKRRIKG